MDKKGAGNMKSEAEKIKDELVSYAKSNNIEGVKEYIKSHKGEITKIYDQYGGENEYLRSAYNLICLSNPKFALEYQKYLETEIAGDVLFLNE